MIYLSGGGNLTIYSRQNEVSVFYNKASIVVVLTNPEMVIETFGLTTLEAMADALPVIVPTQGGIAELVEEGENGYKTNVQQMDVLEEQIKTMLEKEEVYRFMAEKALTCSRNYDSGRMINRIEGILFN